MSDVTALPARLQAGASLDDIIRTIQALQDYVQLRDPDADGGKVDKFVTISTAVQAGLLAYAAGGFASGPAGDLVVPGILTSNPADATPPTPISGLAVASSTAHYLITIDAPTYLQGGGNGRTIIYGANYSGAGPLPTFADASERGTIPGRGVLLVLAAEPGVQTHFWAKAETRHPTLQASPTGGTNGVTATADLIEDQHIVSLTAAKLTAGSVAVSEYIQSTGFVSGSAGWQIKGDGTAEFSGVIVRGTLYATAGAIGGAVIASTYVQSSGYVANTSGWKLDNTAGKIFANSIRITNAAATRIFDIDATGTDPVLKIGSGFYVLADGTVAVSGSGLTVGSSPAVSGSTMTGSGAVFNSGGTFAAGNSTKNISFDGSTLTINGELVLTGNIPAEQVTVPRYASGSGSGNVTTETTICSATVDVDSGALYIDPSATATTTTGVSTTLTLRLKVAGVTVATWTDTGLTGATVTGADRYFDAAPGSGSKTISLTVQSSQTATTTYSGDMFILGMRR